MTPISVLGYIGYNILFALPLVGLIFMIIYSLGSNKRVNLTFETQKIYICFLWLRLLALISLSVVTMI